MKLFVSDLDKTLLNSQHLIPDKNLKGLKMLYGMGYDLCIASGRSYNDICRIMEPLKTKIPIIALNGALVFDKTGKIIASNSIKDKESIENIIKFCEKNKLIYHLYCSNKVFSRKYKNMMEQLYELSTSKFTEIDKIINSMQLYYNAFYFNEVIDDLNTAVSILKKYDIFKLEVISKDKNLLDDITTLLSSDLAYASSSPRNIEITKSNVNKGVALKQLCSYLKTDLENVVAIGDNYNDFEMLKIAGKSIAMGNAEDEIKLISNHITINSDDEGVYYAIKNYL